MKYYKELPAAVPPKLQNLTLNATETEPKYRCLEKFLVSHHQLQLTTLKLLQPAPAEAMVGLIKNCLPTLQDFEFYARKKLLPEIAKLFLPSLQSLGVGTDGRVSVLFSFIANHASQLTRLSLSDFSASSFAPLPPLPKLESLFLSTPDIKDALDEFIRKAPRLREISLQLSDREFLKLPDEVLQHIVKLHVLVSKNQDILPNLTKCPKLKTLFLHGLSQPVPTPNHPCRLRLKQLQLANVTDLAHLIRAHPRLDALVKLCILPSKHKPSSAVVKTLSKLQCGQLPLLSKFQWDIPDDTGNCKDVIAITQGIVTASPRLSHVQVDLPVLEERQDVNALRAMFELAQSRGVEEFTVIYDIDTEIQAYYEYEEGSGEFDEATDGWMPRLKELEKAYGWMRLRIKTNMDAAAEETVEKDLEEEGEHVHEGCDANSDAQVSSSEESWMDELPSDNAEE